MRTKWNLASGQANAEPASSGVPAAVYGEGIRNCTFTRCTFAHIGNYAVEIGRGCYNNHLARCKIFDLGAGGIKIGEFENKNEIAEQTHSNTISDCHIYDCRHIFPMAVGIWSIQSYNNRIIGNYIHDFYYTGISVGWTSDYGP